MAYRVRDILDHWFCQGAITIAQREAGRHFVRLYHATIAGPGHAIDPERFKVDGGLGHGPAAERIIIARDELQQLERVVGRLDFALLCRIVGMGRDLKSDTPDAAERKYLARRVRDALSVIANRDRLAHPASENPSASGAVDRVTV